MPMNDTYDFLLDQTGPTASPTPYAGLDANFLSLADDIVVDVLFTYLEIPDLYRIRRVCKRLYALTHQPMVWKRILRSLSLQVSPLPPTDRFSWRYLSSLETERLIARALSLEANWCSPNPCSSCGWELRAFYEILSVKFAPGGQFLIASIRDYGKTYALLLFMFDHRVHKSYPIAKVPCASKPYRLDVKYMNIGGEFGVTIAYMRREPAKSRDRAAGINVSDFSDDHDIEYPVPVRYEVEVLHSSLQSLQELSDPRFPPGSEAFRLNAESASKPFLKKAHIRSTESLHNLTLGEMGGQPFVVVTRGPDKLIIKNLETGVTSRLEMQPTPGAGIADGEIFKIHGVKLLPHERQALIIRTLTVPIENPGPDPENRSESHMVIEKFKLPLRGETVSSTTCSHTWLQVPRTFTHISISDHSIRPCQDLSAPSTLAPHAEPGPINIYAITSKPVWSIIQFAIWPKRRLLAEIELDASPIDPLPGAPIPPSPLSTISSLFQAQDSAKSPPLKDTGFEFPLGSVFQEDTFGVKPTQNVHIIPGSRRSLIYSTHTQDRKGDGPIMNLEAFVDLTPPPASDPRWPEDADRRAAAAAEVAWAGKAIGGKRDRRCAALTLDDITWGEMKRGVTTIAWEEWSGRIVIVPKEAPKDFRLVEFAWSPFEDHNGHRAIPVDDVDNLYRLPEDKIDPKYAHYRPAGSLSTSNQ